MHLGLLGRCLFLPPPLEKPHVCLSEALTRVIDQIGSHTGQNQLYSPLIVTLGCEFPARVHVGVRDDVEGGLRDYRAQRKMEQGAAKKETGAQH